LQGFIVNTYSHDHEKLYSAGALEDATKAILALSKPYEPDYELTFGVSTAKSHGPTPRP
jgi:hypothetical protein